MQTRRNPTREIPLRRAARSLKAALLLLAHCDSELTVGITLRALQDLATRLETDDEVKVVVFDSADPEFFMAHLDLLGAAAQTGDAISNWQACVCP
jgi:hypothetical protein